ncbi:Lethal(2)neighbour of Tid protein [Morchella snyderi]|nr:Lethal(2)neighbour of Tid protein [Morchella snyderi]
MDIIRSAYSFAFSSHSRLPRWLLCPLLFVEAFLCTLIIKKVPYTEIDWKAYMEQVAQYQAGERDYALIKGGTGPLVYPAGHVYIYSFLSDLTHQGADIVTAQYLFMGLYLSTLAMVFMVYREARVMISAPVYILPLLALSKRLHSIYLLRLFNDPFSIFLLFAAIYCWQKRQWTLGSAAYSLSVGVKMNTLLALPAVAVIYLLACGRDKAIKQAAIMAQIQFLLGAPFLGFAPKSYVTKAFEFSRQFMFKWTVNWRFVGEETFLSRKFSLGLLAVHAVLLSGFIVTRWKKPSQRSFTSFLALIVDPATGLEDHQISQRVSPRYILTSVLTANAIGMLCARSLHYQFYSWLAWGTPYLLWRSGLGPFWVAGLWAVQEWAWNVYPSTNESSGAVVGVLALIVMGSWWGSRGEVEEGVELEDEDEGSGSEDEGEERKTK